VFLPLSDCFLASKGGIVVSYHNIAGRKDVRQSLSLLTSAELHAREQFSRQTENCRRDFWTARRGGRRAPEVRIFRAYI
jgi:hypothetical protein